MQTADAPKQPEPIEAHLTGGEIGTEVGVDEGAEEGAEVGADERVDEGFEVGADEGAEEGVEVGALVGATVRRALFLALDLFLLFASTTISAAASSFDILVKDGRDKDNELCSSQ